MIENLPVRLGSSPGVEPQYYARLTTAAWAIPVTDPLANWRSLYGGSVSHFGTVGLFGSAGFEPKLSNQEIAFVAGLCKGAFYRNEIVRVIRWPFTGQPPGADYRWMAVGCGTIKPWAEYSGGGWVIQPGETINGGQPFPSHTLTEWEEGNSVLPDSFPYQLAPLDNDPPELNIDKPAQFAWCGAQAVFTPILQAPTGTGIPDAPPGGAPMMLGEGGGGLGDGDVPLGG
jgi:hypothetical protein